MQNRQNDGNQKDETDDVCNCFPLLFFFCIAIDDGGHKNDDDVRRQHGDERRPNTLRTAAQQLVVGFFVCVRDCNGKYKIIKTKFFFIDVVASSRRQWQRQRQQSKHAESLIYQCHSQTTLAETIHCAHRSLNVI